MVVNHHVELTEEEKAEARKEAIKRAENEAYNRMAQRKTAPKKESKNSRQSMLSVIVLNTSGAGLPKVLLPAPSADTNGRETEHWQTRFVVAPALIVERN